MELIPCYYWLYQHFGREISFIQYIEYVPWSYDVISVVKPELLHWILCVWRWFFKPNTPSPHSFIVGDGIKGWPRTVEVGIRFITLIHRHPVVSSVVLFCWFKDMSLSVPIDHRLAEQHSGPLKLFHINCLINKGNIFHIVFTPKKHFYIMILTVGTSYGR